MTNFNALLQLSAGHQTRFLGGESVTFQSSQRTVETSAIIDRDIDVIADNGLSSVKRTIVSLKKAEVGSVKNGDRIITMQETFSVNDVLSDDGVWVEVFVRG